MPGGVDRPITQSPTRATRRSQYPWPCNTGWGDGTTNPSTMTEKSPYERLRELEAKKDRGEDLTKAEREEAREALDELKIDIDAALKSIADAMRPLVAATNDAVTKLGEGLRDATADVDVDDLESENPEMADAIRALREQFGEDQ